MPLNQAGERDHRAAAAKKGRRDELEQGAQEGPRTLGADPGTVGLFACERVLHLHHGESHTEYAMRRSVPEIERQNQRNTSRGVAYKVWHAPYCIGNHDAQDDTAGNGRGPQDP